MKNSHRSLGTITTINAMALFTLPFVLAQAPVGAPGGRGVSTRLAMGGVTDSGAALTYIDGN